VIILSLGLQEYATVQILPGTGAIPPAPNPAPPVVIVSAPAQPAAPIEPARRVTANRQGGAGDLVPRRAPRRQLMRGQLLDLLV
jgi:hypothetical protein